MKLISFLGTTAYRQTLYRWQDRTLQTAYTAAACCEFLQPEELIVFATEEAYEKNWTGLCEAVRQINGPEPLYRKIPLGKNEEELWQIFSDLTEAIPAGSEIAIDLTNGQRSLPAVVILASIFMKTGLDVKVSNLFYGAYNVDPDTPDHSPMFDLTPMLNLVDWGIAAEHFNRDGDARDLTNQFIDFARNYAKEHTGEERVTGHTLRKLGEGLDEISRCYLLLRPRQIREAETKLKENMEKAKSSLGNVVQQRPLQLLLDRLEATYLPSRTAEPDEGLEMLTREREMIQWYRNHGHFMQAAALSREWLLTWFMVMNGVKTAKDLDNTELREEYNTKLNSEPDALQLPSCVDRDHFIIMYKTLGDRRNDLMHAGKRENPAKPKRMYETVNEQIDLLMQLPVGEEDK